jgi:23S rRNA (cytosine1962-C5)-methyltransferase
MTILTTPGWSEYALLDSGNGRRLEKFGPYALSRPDPQCLWQPGLPIDAWEKADAVFTEKNTKGKWVNSRFIPDSWKMHYKDITFYAKLTPFKHTGVFPEQHLHWDWLEKKVKNEGLKIKNEKIKVLNLFAYTGVASLVCAAAGADVTHVDASYPTIGWARENQALSSLSDKPIRWILDDCLKFVEREIKRGVRYDGIIMDPPVFGHGPKGERWEFNESFPLLLKACQQVLTDQPLFVLINAYAVSASALMLQNMLEDTMEKYKGKVESGELALEEKTRKRLLSTGIFARWSK